MSAFPRKRATGNGRVRLFAMVACAALAVHTIQGQTQKATPTSAILIDLVAPPPIERSISPLTVRSPDDPATRRELSMEGTRTAALRVGASSARYRPGRVIVKFRDGSTTASRGSTLRAVSRTASLSTRPDHTDFDIITTDPSNDPESVRARFSSGLRSSTHRPRIGCAQGSGRTTDSTRDSGTSRSSIWSALGTCSLQRPRPSRSPFWTRALRSPTPL